MNADELFVSLSPLSNNDACKNLKRLQKCLKKGKFRRQFIEKNGISKLASGLSAISDEGHEQQHQLDMTLPSSTEDRSMLVSEILSCLTKLVPGNKTCISQVGKSFVSFLRETFRYSMMYRPS